MQNNTINITPVIILRDNLELLTPVEKLNFLCPQERPIYPWIEIFIVRETYNEASWNNIVICTPWGLSTKKAV